MIRATAMTARWGLTTQVLAEMRPLARSRLRRERVLRATFAPVAGFGGPPPKGPPAAGGGGGPP
ncbi:hypothetical protein, partial [Nocardia abscessus]|uniref:hypothetical protein n=1 Tax=Nocardia abscessus TaxID=120957 RepID=UPI002455897F